MAEPTDVASAVLCRLLPQDVWVHQVMAFADCCEHLRLRNQGGVRNREFVLMWEWGLREVTDVLLQEGSVFRYCVSQAQRLRRVECNVSSRTLAGMDPSAAGDLLCWCIHKATRPKVVLVRSTACSCVLAAFL